MLIGPPGVIVFLPGLPPRVIAAGIADLRGAEIHGGPFYGEAKIYVIMAVATFCHRLEGVC
jgi:hypothetical protein